MRALALAGCLLWAAAKAMAAPLPPLPAADLCGSILSREWVAERRLAAVPGASGSMGHERIVPAHLRVILGQVTGIPGDLADRLSFLAGASAGEVPRGGMLLLLAVSGPHELTGAVSLCVSGYEIRGDEGITLTSFRSLSAG